MTISNADPAPPRRPLTVRPRWGGAILVCGKCARKHVDGKAIRSALKDEARRQLGLSSASDAATGKRRRKVKIVKTACLGLCPKNAVVAASAATLAAGELVLLRGESDVAGALAQLLPPAVKQPAVVPPAG